MKNIYNLLLTTQPITEYEKAGEGLAEYFAVKVLMSKLMMVLESTPTENLQKEYAFSRFLVTNWSESAFFHKKTTSPTK